MDLKNFMDLVVNSLNDSTEYKASIESEYLKQIKIMSESDIEFDLRIQPMNLGKLKAQDNLDPTVNFFKLILKSVKSQDFKKAEEDYYIKVKEYSLDYQIFRANLQTLEFSLFYDENEDMNIEIDKLLFQLLNNLKALTYDYNCIYNSLVGRSQTEPYNHILSVKVDADTFSVCTIAETISENENFIEVGPSRTELYVQNLNEQGGEPLIIEGSEELDREGLNTLLNGD